MITITQETAQKLRDLADHIEFHDRFTYGHWVSKHGTRQGALMGIADSDAARLSENCDTAGCVAGWAVDLAFHRGELDEERLQDPDFRVGREAAEWLGLGEISECSLFYGRSAYQTRIISPEEEWSELTSAQAAKMLRIIANGDGDNWEVV